MFRKGLCRRKVLELGLVLNHTLVALCQLVLYILIAEEEAFNSFYNPSEYPITKVLRQPVYVEVRVLGRSDPNIILNLEHCWATATPNPQSLPQWDLLVNGYDTGSLLGRTAFLKY